ncbi:MAG: hypothetical protein KDD11_20350, partial [Acidobacteria bacterium]|nr:hypothetical protein [Acidobacteriota bacterium]
AAGTSDPDYSKGKLVRATRFNYPGPETWAITERYTYGGALGQLSRKRLQLQLPDRSLADGRYQATFDQTYGYDALGQRTSLGYPQCVATPETGDLYCNDPEDLPAPPHTATWAIRHGRIVRASSSLGLVATYGYHDNGQLGTIDYGNGTRTEIGVGTHNLARPASIRTTRTADGVELFSTGTFLYDGAGNLAAIGTDRYTFDAASRLLSGTVKSVGAGKREDYKYDLFDNLTEVARDGSGVWEGYLVDAKNRVTGFGPENSISYDAAGNLTAQGFALGIPAGSVARTYEYDALNMASKLSIEPSDAGEPLHELIYIYGPGNYRVMVFDGETGKRHWTLRDLDGKPLRQLWVWRWGPYRGPADAGETWTFEKDFVYGAGGMFASYGSGGVERYFHRDHLGSTRVISDDHGSSVYRAAFYPYGTEIPLSDIGEDTSKFTGHERDATGRTDYMLARNFDLNYARFLSVDTGRDSWNLYGYVGGNPIRGVDATGLWESDFHLGFTGLAARIAGASPAQAQKIAASTQAVDTAPSTQPATLDKSVRRDHHFASRQQLARLEARARKDPFKDLGEGRTPIGDYIHALQDSYSHQVRGRALQDSHFNSTLGLTCGFPCIGPRDAIELAVHVNPETGKRMVYQDVDDTTQRPWMAYSAFQATVAAISSILGTTEKAAPGDYQLQLFQALKAERDSSERRRLVDEIRKMVQ